MGVFAVIIHMGCLYLVRRIQKDSAGHWLALTQAAVSIGSTLLYILDWKFDMSSQAQYILLTSIVCIVSTVFVIVPFNNQNVLVKKEKLALSMSQESSYKRPWNLKEFMSSSKETSRRG